MQNEKFNNYDVFHSFLVENADYEGYFELPVIKTSKLIPEKLVPFSKAMSKTWNDFDCWVMFYEHDIKFERLGITDSNTCAQCLLNFRSAVLSGFARRQPCFTLQ